MFRHSARLSCPQTLLRSCGLGPSYDQQQSNFASTTAPTENVREFKEMPRISAFSLLRSLLPGGNYYKKTFDQVLLQMKQQYGAVHYWPSLLGREGFVITHNAFDFEKIYRNEGTWPNRFGNEAISYHRTVHRAEDFGGIEGLLSSQDEQWSKMRSIINPVLMKPQNIRLYLPKMAEVSKDFLNRILQIRDPTTLEVPATFVKEINRWTLESVAVVALNKQLGLLKNNQDDQRANALFHHLNQFFVHQYEVEILPPIWKYYKTRAFKKLIHALDEMTNIVSSYIDEAVQLLNEQKAKGVQRAFNEQSVLEKLHAIDASVAKVMALDMFLAGVDTTTSSLTGLLLCLAKNPDKQEKLRQEILRVLPSKDAEFSETTLDNIPYLKACFKESMRMYPLVIINARVVQHETIVGGFRIPKGTDVAMISASLNYDEQHFPRAHEYLPERWLRAEQQNVAECAHALKISTPFAYLPFGFGSRMCIGKRLAEMELEVGAARLLRNFKVEYNYCTDNAFRNLLINVPNIPLKFRFIDLDK